MITLTVLGKPIAKARARVTKSGFSYTPESTVSYENLIKLAWQDSQQSKLPDVELTASLTFEFQVPKAKLSKFNKGIYIPHTSKPDLDNLAKSVLDALNGLAYTDDSQISFLQVSKIYGNEPKVTIRIESK